VNNYNSAPPNNRVVEVIEMLLDFVAGVACIIGGAITLALGFLLRNRSTDSYRTVAPTGVVGCFFLLVGLVVVLKLLVG
jgi:drug/metabolite transporter (DMT)-like permease